MLWRSRHPRRYRRLARPVVHQFGRCRNRWPGGRARRRLVALCGTTPVVETRTVTATQSIPFATKTVSDSSSAKGSTRVKVTGVTGVKTLTYEVTYTNGVETGRKLVREVITQPPVTQVIAVGTKVTQQCDPNYSGACVPIASDVDCAGGSGDGPAYVRGPVRVIGTDIYDLDRDGDGIGCE